MMQNGPGGQMLEVPGWKNQEIRNLGEVRGAPGAGNREAVTRVAARQTQEKT
ncbi:hypothetical protein M3I54_01880 [Paraburkholderia sp. CNPSo 3274]|uniref:hypothetical protein n=1 Tax=Paraburkholderia sp. CNPSo 3274 TaxID=2940932 RepID=UPI0020B89BFF|nr:hypothetical protein [Paraburkholderia sp. CNPSo 3274]MCP3705749.1 hypothetical protein [Paraburkholderia sp. CNPSo 3274]